MDESINTANKKQSRQKPPLSSVRIVGEILAGMVIGVAVAVLVSCPILYVLLCDFFGAPADWSKEGEFGALLFFALVIFALRPFLMVYGPATAIGVYLVGNKGEQTGSFLLTLGGGLFCGIVMTLLFWKGLLPITEKAVWGFMLIIVPIVATLGFNLTRKYKVQRKQTDLAKSVALITLIILAVCSIALLIKDIGYYGLIIPLILLILALVFKMKSRHK